MTIADDGIPVKKVPQGRVAAASRLRDRRNARAAVPGGDGYTSVVTLMDRIQSTDVLKAVSGDIWSAKIAGRWHTFGVALLLLHVMLAVVGWLLACASAAIWPEARAKFSRVVVGWLCMLATATLAYNALWYPRRSSAPTTTT